MPTIHIVHPNVEDAFPNTKYDFDEFVKQLGSLSKTDALIFCFRVNHILSDPNKDHQQTQEKIASLFFSEEAQKNILASGEERRSISDFAFTTRAAITILARWATMFCEDKEGDGTTFKKQEVRDAFAKAMLIANQIWQKSIGMEKMLDDVPLDEARKNMLNACRQNAHGSFAHSQYGIFAIGRGYTLFCNQDYFPQFHPTFEGEFKDATGLTIQEYYTCIIYFFTNVIETLRKKPDDHDGKVIFRYEEAVESVPEGARGMFSRFLELETQDIEELQSSFWKEIKPPSSFEDVMPLNDIPLRSKPIYQVSDGRLMLIDPVLFTDKITAGPIFSLIKHGKKSNEEVTQLFADFGKAFERYVVNILSGMYPESPLAGNRLECPLLEANGDELADACIDDIEEIVLFEIKASFLNQQAIIQNDPDVYIDLLRKKYVEDEDGKPKGVTQLARAVEKIAMGNEVQKRDFSKLKRVFPVLLVHDELIDAPLHPHFFNNEFIEKLVPDEKPSSGYMKKGNLLVAPLTLMTFEDLETLEFSVQKGFALKELLADYAMSSSDRLDSLNNYIAGSSYNKKLFASKSTASKGLEALEKTRKDLFHNEE